MTYQDMMTQDQEKSSYLYLQLADRIEAQIRNGQFQSGEKLPSIRMLHRQTGLSISTVYQAFTEMEKRGMVRAREKSGYYVMPQLEEILPCPPIVSTPLEPSKVTVNNLTFALIEAMADPGVLQLGGALISPEMLPSKELMISIKNANTRDARAMWTTYSHYQGYLPLRHQIAKRMSPVCGSTTAEELVITNGCMEAVSLCLQAVAKSGDTILVSAPTFPWFLQIIEDFGMYALEVPADPAKGIDLIRLEEALERYRVQAAILMVNFSNPLGYLMSDRQKKTIMEMLTVRDIPIIEDDIYGDLYFGVKRPVPLKAFDRKGLVLHCSSFSKTLAPGLRVGWTKPGRFLGPVSRLKLNQSVSNSNVTQMAAAEYLTKGHYDRHLRKLRTFLQNGVSNMAFALARHFPHGIKISAPKGGFTLWVQGPEDLDSLELFRRALELKIAVMPGIVCSTRPIFRNCFRLSCGMPFDSIIEKGVQTLADLIKTISRMS